MHLIKYANANLADSSDSSNHSKNSQCAIEDREQTNESKLSFNPEISNLSVQDVIEYFIMHFRRAHIKIING